MPIYKVKGRYYVRVEKDGVKWTPAKAGMLQTSWRTKKEARVAEAELRHRIEKLKTTPTSLDLLTLCNEYLKDAKISFVGHDTFAGKQRLCKELLEKWGNLPVEEITVHMAQTYLLERANGCSTGGPIRNFFQNKCVTLSRRSKRKNTKKVNLDLPLLTMLSKLTWLQPQIKKI